jgi:hypothetical protein
MVNSTSKLNTSVLEQAAFVFWHNGIVSSSDQASLFWSFNDAAAK